MKAESMSTYICPMLAFAILLAVDSGMSGPKQSEVNVQTSQMVLATLCEVLAKPEDYHGKRISITARFRSLITNEAILVSPECELKDQAVSVGYEEGRVDQLSEEINTFLNGLRIESAEVRVLGRFHKSTLGTSNRGFGHMGRYKYQFEIAAFEEIKQPQRK